MTPEQAKIVADSFSKFESRLPELGAAVYDTLFHAAPETRAMFKGDMDLQHRKLVSVIGEFANLRRRSQHFLPVTGNGGVAVVPGIDRLRSGHASAGVKTGHYTLMRNAILKALKGVLGAEFDGRMEEAWGAAFDTLAGTLQRPESVTPDERKLLSSMFGRKFENPGIDDTGAHGSASADAFFDGKASL
jgi:hemoglobin-like flavoprotein